MIKIEQLKGICKGSCIVVAHGRSYQTFPWDKYLHIPKIQVNFYNPDQINVQGVVCWDKDILKSVKEVINSDPTTPSPFIFFSGWKIDKEYHIFLDPETFPPKSGKKVFSGPRAIYLSQYLGYNNIYLVGFDFIPHTVNQDKEYLVQRKEIDHFKDAPEDIYEAMDTQMKSFYSVTWIHNNIFQTNPDSKLDMFTYKLPEESK